MQSLLQVPTGLHQEGEETEDALDKTKEGRDGAVRWPASRKKWRRSKRPAAKPGGQPRPLKTNDEAPAVTTSPGVGSHRLQDQDTAVETGEKAILLAAKPYVVMFEVSLRFRRTDKEERRDPYVVAGEPSDEGSWPQHQGQG